MPSDVTTTFRKNNLDTYLEELAREYRRLAGSSIPAEIILIGGAAIVEKYGFRDMTTDVDAIISAVSVMKEAVNRVGDRNKLPNGWLNADFEKTGSYSEKLVQYSRYYRTFNHVLNVRIVTGEYLIAMKLHAFRQYKNDVSDIIGILAEHNCCGDDIDFTRIDKAVNDLYGSWEGISEEARNFIKDALTKGNYSDMYELARINEKLAREQLIDFNDNYPGVLKGENAGQILNILREKKSKSK